MPSALMKNSAFLFGRIRPDKEQEVLDSVQRIAGVDYAVLLYGREDLLAKISAEDVESLYRHVLSKVREIPGLQLTKTFVCKPGAKGPIDGGTEGLGSQGTKAQGHTKIGDQGTRRAG